MERGNLANKAGGRNRKPLNPEASVFQFTTVLDAALGWTATRTMAGRKTRPW
jgi:hypothetical protein